MNSRQIFCKGFYDESRKSAGNSRKDAAFQLGQELSQLAQRGIAVFDSETVLGRKEEERGCNSELKANLLQGIL